MKDNFLERDLSYKLVGCFYDIRNKYGRYRREKVYDRVLSEHLKAKSITFIDKPQIPIYSLDSGHKIGICIPDKLISGKIIVEIKSKPITTQKDKIQTMEYLQTSIYQIIYLANFGEEHFQPRRFILTNDRKPFLNIGFNPLLSV